MTFFFTEENNNFDLRDVDGFLFKLFGLKFFCKLLLDDGFKAEGLKAFLNDKDSKFDMVITETFFCQEPFIALGHKYGAIQVSVQSIELFLGLARATGNPHNPAYVPSHAFPSSHHMNFWARSKSTFANLMDYIATHAVWMYLVLSL